MKKHIMFVSLPLRGHTNQMIALAQELVCRGYQVSFAIAEEAREWLANTGANFIQWEPRQETTDEGINDKNKSVWQRASQEQSIWRGEKMMLNGLIDLYVPMYKTLLAIFQQYNPDILVIDRAVIPAMDLAQQMKIPYIIQTRFLGNFVPSSSKYPRFGTSYSVEMNIWQRLVNFLRPYLLMPHFLPVMRKLNQVRSECSNCKKIKDPFSQRPIIVGTAFGIEIPRPLPPHVQMVGPIFPKTIEPLSPSLRKWLEEIAEVTIVYIAFGTLATIESWQAQALVDGLSDPKFRVLWSLPKSQQHILPALPSSFRIEDFVPQQAVLSHPIVRAFISHCGMNSINEALHWEKPILALPFFGDQHYNAARIVDLGAALKLNKKHFDSTEVRRKMDALLSKPNYIDAARRMSVLFKSTGGLDRAADIVESTLTEGIS
ncbi:glycosyltransferase [Iningainema tapete]|uniref:Glycosyltransferase family 1 protein n=1 Tax=Iningainema tapete BLCC-T55 TaxID=2748662 RepID=A0A8J7C0A8_9CYAN|nr:glycosyltransferase [Iningainema tapete]MBD2777693.1 glycosyltransferase family 1 protein [Iningainema tapete BLCC-T55]